jgi:hypothetical protein
MLPVVATMNAHNAICRTPAGETSRVRCANGPRVFNGPSVTNNPVKIAEGSIIVALCLDRALDRDRR